MPRKPRMYLPDVPCHIVQRGNNRNNCFFTEHDYHFYLACLKDSSRRYGVVVHAYVLMTNHVHLLMTPLEKDSISRAMQSIGRRYVQHVNYRHGRSGTLWEGRHRASLVDSERYLLTCMRYIELNPVRAKMVDHPAEYQWSSYRANACGEPSRLLRGHQTYNSLGVDERDRVQAYRALFASQLAPTDIKLIRQALLFSVPTGDDQFKQRVEAATGIVIGHAFRGRPSVRNPAKCK